MVARKHLSIVLAALAGLPATERPAAAQLNSYGTGLGPSENLSTPPNRRHGGYWDSTSANRGAARHRHQHRRATATNPPQADRDPGK